MCFWNEMCKSEARIDGKTVVITGANTGIGKETALDMVLRGGNVIIACRDLPKAKTALEEIRGLTKNFPNSGKISFVYLDLDSLQSVRDCAENLLRENSHIHILINNAGVMGCPRGLTKDGFERQFGVNHLGHFLLTCLLLPKMRASAPARIVNVSSKAHEFGTITFDDLMREKSYSPTGAYCQSKLANVLFTKELARRLHGSGVHVYAVHPGIIDTQLTRHLSTSYFSGITWLYYNVLCYILKTPKQGAQTTIFCAIDENCANETGLYYSECKLTDTSIESKDPEIAKRLWNVSSKLVGLEEWNPFTTLDKNSKIISSKRRFANLEY